MEWNGHKIGITICEDIWTEEYLHRPLYRRDPVEELRKQGAELILNLSASPYHIGKTSHRRQLLCDVAKEHLLPIVYCNAIAGNDQLIFDGHSVVINENGEPVEQLEGFAEEVWFGDSD